MPVSPCARPSARGCAGRGRPRRCSSSCRRRTPAGSVRRLGEKRNSSANTSIRAGGRWRGGAGRRTAARGVRDAIDGRRRFREPSRHGDVRVFERSGRTPLDTVPAASYDVGIAGAGQLARMTCLAAWPLGVRVAVLGRPDEPAGPMAAGVVDGDWKDAEDVAAPGRGGRRGDARERVRRRPGARRRGVGRDGGAPRRGLAGRGAGQGAPEGPAAPPPASPPRPSSWSSARATSPPPAGSWAGR